MVQIMRTWLAEAAVVNIALDDRGRYKLVRFHCDTGLAPPQAWTELGSRSGIIAVINSSLGLTEEDFDDDYALRVIEKVSAAIRLFYAGLDGSTDEVQVQALRIKVRQVAADLSLIHI